MSSTGYIQVHAYTSDARIPVEGTAIAVLNGEGTLLGTRVTNSSGQIRLISVTVPDREASLDPSFTGKSYTTVTIRAQAPGYEQIQVDRVQVFAGTLTIQPLELVPLPLYPDAGDGTEYFDVPPQNL